MIRCFVFSKTKKFIKKTVWYPIIATSWLYLQALTPFEDLVDTANNLPGSPLDQMNLKDSMNQYKEKDYSSFFGNSYLMEALKTNNLSEELKKGAASFLGITKNSESQAFFAYYLAEQEMRLPKLNNDKTDLEEKLKSEAEKAKDVQNLTDQEKSVQAKEKEKLNKNIENITKQIQKMEEEIKGLRESKKENFENIVKQIEDEKNLDPEVIFKLLDSFLSVIICASLEDVKSIQNLKDETENDNDLYKMQLKFVKAMNEIFSDNDSGKVDQIIYNIIKKDRFLFSNYLAAIAYNPAWNEKNQLELIECIEKIKTSVIRGGNGYVEDGAADSRGFIPSISWRFSNFFDKEKEAFTYGISQKRENLINKKWSGLTSADTSRDDPFDDFDKRNYPTDFTVGEKLDNPIILTMSKKVIEKMRESDKQFTSLGHYYGNKYFKSSFNLATFRQTIADILQFSYAGAALIKSKIRKFKSMSELASLIRIIPKWAFCSAVWFALLPVVFLEQAILYS